MSNERVDVLGIMDSAMVADKWRYVRTEQRVKRDPLPELPISAGYEPVESKAVTVQLRHYRQELGYCCEGDAPTLRVIGEDELAKVRAAVAELIEAAGTYEEAVRLFGRTSPSVIRAYDSLCAALSRIGGKDDRTP